MIIFGYIMIILLGLIVGSFLNVVIYRLPLMMKREWHQQSCEILGQNMTWNQQSVSLLLPRSHCPHCGHTLKAQHMIPILSFCWLKGKCAQCAAPISYRYPIIELLAAATAAVVFWRFGYSWETVLVVVLSWGLIAASAIDIAEHFIPDSITLSLLWLGLLANAIFMFTTPTHAILGAVFGYIFFWCVAKIFYVIRRKEGLGYGDFKLIALFGAWLGPWSILNIIIVSCILGIVVSLIFVSSRKIKLSSQIPFGPFLAIAGWCTMIFGDFLTNVILN